MINLIAHLADWVWLVPALPLFALIFIGSRVLLGRATGDAAEPLTASLASLAALGGFLLLLGIDGMALWHGTVPGHRVIGTWFASGHWQGTISFLLDGLSLSISTLTALIGWLVIRFSAHYIHREAGFHRFFIVPVSYTHLTLPTNREV